MRCPFCSKTYEYKTANGLFIHILSFHIIRRYSGTTEILRFIYLSDKGSQTIAITEEDLKELRDFILDYSRGIYNPSKTSARWWSYVRRGENGTGTSST